MTKPTGLPRKKHLFVARREKEDMQAAPIDTHLTERCIRMRCYHQRRSHGMGGTGRYHSETRACFFLSCKCTGFKMKGRDV